MSRVKVFGGVLRSMALFAILRSYIGRKENFRRVTIDVNQNPFYLGKKKRNSSCIDEKIFLFFSFS